MPPPPPPPSPRPFAAGNWSHLDLDGKTADLFAPAGDAPRFAVVLLHDRDGVSVRDNAVFTAELQRQGLAAVVPRGGECWWLDRIVKEFDETVSPLSFVHDRVVEAIGDRWRIEPPAIGVAGIGMGGQGALQLSYRFPRRFPVVAAIAPAVDLQHVYGQGSSLDEVFASAESVRQETVTLRLHPLNWPPQQLFVCDPRDEWHEGCERLASKLSSMGIPFESDLTTSAGGHTWAYFEAMAPRVIGFLAEKLDRVSRSR